MSENSEGKEKKRGLFGFLGRKKKDQDEESPEAEESASAEDSDSESEGADAATVDDAVAAANALEGLLIEEEEAEPASDESGLPFTDEELPDDSLVQGTEVAIPAEPAEDAATDPPAAESEEEVEAAPAKKKGVFARFRDKLRATHDAIFSRMETTFLRTHKVDEELFEDLEEILITADVGVETTLKLIEDLRAAARREKRERRDSIEWLREHLGAELRRVIGEDKSPLNEAEEGPTIVLVVGVNGVGKTTAIGKIAHRYRQQGKSVMMVAGDTFRAAAIEQLAAWAERSNAEIVRGQEGADPGSILFDAMRRAKSRQPDLVLVDTAGRLHTKTNLMAELGKLGRIIDREFPGAPHETLLVLDASTGHNGLQQAKIFAEAVNLTGICLNKLDGTAKGGVTIAVHHELEVPVKLVGLGEKIDDLDDFDPKAFIDAILS